MKEASAPTMSEQDNYGTIFAYQTAFVNAL